MFGLFLVWFYALSVSTLRGYAFRRSVILAVCVGGRKTELSCLSFGSCVVLCVVAQLKQRCKKRGGWISVISTEKRVNETGKRVNECVFVAKKSGER